MQRKLRIVVLSILAIVVFGVLLYMDMKNTSYAIEGKEVQTSETRVYENILYNEHL